MSEELEIFKKKLLYRASYRGTKEMDIILSNFVKKYIDSFNRDQLLELEKYRSTFSFLGSTPLRLLKVPNDFVPFWPRLNLGIY